MHVYHIVPQLIYKFDQSHCESSRQEKFRCVFMNVPVREHCTFNNQISRRGEIYCPGTIIITSLM